MKTIVLNNRYSIGKGTPEEIKKFNDFYDLEEARFAYEEKIQREWAITHFMETVF
jgi:hypothetical protein